MIPVALALALALAPAPPPALPVWRLVERPDIHVGARPAAFVTDGPREWAIGASIQISVR